MNMSRYKPVCHPARASLFPQGTSGHLTGLHREVWNRTSWNMLEGALG